MFAAPTSTDDCPRTLLAYVLTVVNSLQCCRLT